MGKASRRYISAKHANKYEGLYKSYAEGRKVPNGKELVANVELVNCKPTQTYDDGGRKKHKSYATGRKKHKPTKTYDDGGRKLKSNKSGKQSVTNENLVKQLMCLAHHSPQLLQQLKRFTLMTCGKENITKFIKAHLSTVAFDKRRWAAGMKSLLAKSIANEERSKQPAQYVAKEDVVETESTLPPIRPNTKSCDCELATTSAATKKQKSITDVSSMLSHSQAPAKKVRFHHQVTM